MFLSADSNVKSGKERSFADDLNVQRGIVSSRVALLLRSAEIKPLLSDLFFYFFLSGYWQEPGPSLERSRLNKSL